MRTKFLEEVFAGQSEKTANAFYVKWMQIEAVEKEIGKTIEDGLCEENYILFLSKFKSRTVVSFYVLKSAIMRYMRWLLEKGYIDAQKLDAMAALRFEDVPLDDEDYSRKFFKDFDSLRETVESMILIAIDEYGVIDEARYDTEVAAIYLSWFGVSQEDICKIEKRDLTDSGVMVNGKEVYLPDFVSDFLKKYAVSEGFQQQSRGLMMRKYTSTSYLLRTCKTKNDMLSVTNLRTSISHFSEIYNKYQKENDDGKDNKKGHQLNLSTIYWSGIYSRAYEYECENGLIQPFDYDTIKKIFGETYDQDRFVANKRLRSYQAYKKVFHLEDPKT
jgi:hypothetical protein